ncbi:MAG: hydantoinase/oxoprolinase family protein, partial [Solirubrobacterales bacterium]
MGWAFSAGPRRRRRPEIYRVGIDVGGTFTDAVCVLKGEEAPETAKVLTTYPDPAVGVVQVLGEFALRRGVEPVAFCAKLETIVHGTTVTTNALLTGGLARTGLLATSGFRDSLEMRKGYREAMYDNRYQAPPPVVPRELRLGVRERVAADGSVVAPVDDEGLDAALEALASAEVESVAISFMHSYANPSHERQVLERVRGRLGESVYVTASTDVLGRIGYFERTSTTCVNAGAGPLFRRYLRSLAERLDEVGFEGLLLIMQSGGGMASLERAAELACNSLLSGPAGGVVAAQRHAAVHGYGHCLSMDMGGTSFDICAIEDGEPLATTEASVGPHRVATPMVDIRTIGAGGGSIAWVDSGGLLRVGPQSAGSTPGPACYGRGGELPTVTDANLVLGYLDPADFWDGRLQLDRERSVA